MAQSIRGEFSHEYHGDLNHSLLSTFTRGYKSLARSNFEIILERRNPSFWPLMVYHQHCYHCFDTFWCNQPAQDSNTNHHGKSTNHNHLEEFVTMKDQPCLEFIGVTCDLKEEPLNQHVDTFSSFPINQSMVIISVSQRRRVLRPGRIRSARLDILRDWFPQSLQWLI